MTLAARSYLLFVAALGCALALLGGLREPLGLESVGLLSDEKVLQTLRLIALAPMAAVVAIESGAEPRGAWFWIAALAAALVPLWPGQAVLAILAAAALGFVVMRRSGAFSASRLPEPVAVDAQAARLRLWTLGLIGAGLALRLATFHEPLERDLMAYATVAGGWLDGAQLYAEVWDHKPPAVYVAYAAALAVAGQGPLAIWLLGAIFFALTLLGVRHAAERLAGQGACVPAMLIWTVCGSDLILQANQPNVEVFINACLVWALVLLLPARNAVFSGPHLSTTAIIGAGVLFLIASLFKQIAAFPALLAALALALEGLRAGAFLRGLRMAALIAAIGAGGWALVALAFKVNGTLDAFLYGVFGYNSEYAGSIFNNFKGALLYKVWHPYYYIIFFGLFFMHFVAAINQSRHAMVTAFYIGIAVMIVAPGKFYQHYFQLMVPLVSISGGALLAFLLADRRPALGALIAVAPVWLGFGMLTAPERPALVKYGEELTRTTIEAERIGEWIANEKPLKTRILHWGTQPGVYFWSGRPTHYRFSFNFPLLGDGRSARLLGEFIEQISCMRPDLVVVEISERESPPAMARFLREHFRRVSDAPQFDAFELLEPSGSGLACPIQRMDG